MLSSNTGLVADYIGIDPTDRYAKKTRPVDVCGLTPVDGGKLNAHFWQWTWPKPSAILRYDAILKEVQSAKGVMIDGPQGFAAMGGKMRECERASGAVGKTPDALPPLKVPFAGFIRSSIELFAGLKQQGIAISPANFLGGACEVYPGNLWYRIAGRNLPNKSTSQGRALRKAILELLGVCNLPELPNHDENDACIGALMAAAADGKVNGLGIAAIGSPLVEDEGILREGPMAIPVIAPNLRAQLDDLVRSQLGQGQDVCIQPRLNLDRERMQRAHQFLNEFAKKAASGEPQLCTYAWAYRTILGQSYTRWSRQYAKQVTEVAENTASIDVAGLGKVRLDAFVVTADNRAPGEGHWEGAGYTPDDWERILGTGLLLA